MTSLADECTLFTYYLTGRRPDEYIQEKYRQWHESTPPEDAEEFLDLSLLRAAHANAFLLKLADTYTSLFYKSARVRKKLVFLLAILECRETTYRNLDSVDTGSRRRLYVSVFKKTVLFSLSLVLSILLFSPFKLCSIFRKIR